MDWEEHLQQIIQDKIDKHEIPGILGGVHVGGKELFYFAYGKADLDKDLLMNKDTIFRIHSMSKPICAVAIWQFIEKGKISIDDPIEQYLPEFSNVHVVDIDNQIVPCKVKPTIRHFLNMTAGCSYDDCDIVGKQVAQLFQEVYDLEKGNHPITTREFVRRIAGIPLSFQPGERWRYGLCTDVLGAVIEVVSKMSLGEYYRQEIFSPLEMEDTGFYVPKEKQDRFATMYKTTLEPDTDKHLGLGDFCHKPSFESAGAGLVSTYNDYIRFANMLANGGEYNGKKIISRETVEKFAENQLTKEQLETVNFEHMRGYGYGNFMRVGMCREDMQVPGKEHSFGWDGWSGPYMSVDLKSKKVILFFLQIAGYNDWEFNAEILKKVLV